MIPSLAADRNNDAVSLIDTGNMDAAICGLSHLVEGFRNFVCDHNNPNENSEDNLRPTTLSLDQCMAISQPCKADDDEDEASSTDSGEHSDDDQANRFVYRTGIRMPSSVAFDKDRDRLMSSIFLFNLGLAHQLRAEAITKNAEQQHTLYAKALKIYGLAFKMQERGGYFNSNFHFIMAILNNIGVIHERMGSLILAKQCFGKLMSVLMLLTERKCYDTSKLYVKGFFTNASLSCHEACTAAAA
ncbi:unnamed protein product [Cylindrotheca closterium]|uniref:Uncharacterized protein n=1 Tax=Cylindrotheca closterium TaxID=2856 RepID=A0AAD2FWK4_9STRA|nr:unnamed protein product [Cylindrotheca closterium]